MSVNAVPFRSSMACRVLLPAHGRVRCRLPLQKLPFLSRPIHHHYSSTGTPSRVPCRSAARSYSSLTRPTYRFPRPPQGGPAYQQRRSFWVARLAARFLKLRYLLLGSAVGGGYTAKKVRVRHVRMRST